MRGRATEGNVLDFEELSTDADVRAAEEFVAAQVGRQLGTLDEGGEEVAAALDAEGLHEAAEVVRAACTEPLGLTLRQLTILAMTCGRVPVLSLPVCPHPATNPDMAAVMREYATEAR
jgi:hypothetical protein